MKNSVRNDTGRRERQNRAEAGQERASISGFEAGALQLSSAAGEPRSVFVGEPSS